jgi:signal transduction histidine kinase
LKDSTENSSAYLMSTPPGSSDRYNSSDSLVEKRIRESVDILKNVMESRFNRLFQANRRLKRKIFDLYTVFELSRRLNSVLDLDVLSNEMLSALSDELGIENIVMFLPRDLSSDDLSCFKLGGKFEVPTNAHRNVQACGNLDELKISHTGNLARLLLTQREPLFLKEIQAQLKDPESEIDLLHSLDSWLVVPLISRDKLVGILSFGPKKTGQRISDSDLEFISVLVGQLSVAVENALLYQSQTKINDELKNTQKQLIQSEKLAATGQFSASLAHEINNPLGIIKNYLQILSDSIEENPTNRHNVEAIKEEVDRIARIVKSFLDFSRPAKEEMSLLSLKEAIKQIVFLVEKEFSTRGIKIRTVLPENLPWVMGSEDQLKQVFLNLLVNSRDFMQKGGEITINLRESGKMAEIEFSDTGCGIPEDNINRIFDPFFTTKSNGKGTGLGLWICYGIIQRHGGNIQVIGKNPGTSFIISLPQA